MAALGGVGDHRRRRLPHQPARSEPGGARPIHGGEVERRHEYVVAGRQGGHHRHEAGGGSKSASVGAFLISTFTSTPVHTARRRRGAARRGEVGGGRLGDRPAVRQVGVMVDGGGMIGRAAHVELDAMRSHRHRPAERGEGVLRFGAATHPGGQ